MESIPDLACIVGRYGNGPGKWLIFHQPEEDGLYRFGMRIRKGFTVAGHLHGEDIKEGNGVYMLDDTIPLLYQRVQGSMREQRISASSSLPGVLDGGGVERVGQAHPLM